MTQREQTAPFLSTKRIRDWKLLVLILITTSIWGFAWVLMKVSLNYMGPFTFSTVRFFIGSLTLIIILLMRRMTVPDRKYWPHLMILGLLQTTFIYMFVMFGLQFVDAGKSSVILYTTPIWTSILAKKFLNETVSAAKIAGIALGGLGLASIIGWDVLINSRPSVILGECLILLAALSWSTANVYYRKKLSGLDQMQVNTYQMFFGAIGLLIGAMVSEWNQSILFTPISVSALLIAGVFASALCFSIWFYLLMQIDTVTVTISSLLVPVFGVTFSVLFLDEPVTINIALGSVLILTGVLVSQINNKRQEQK